MEKEKIEFDSYLNKIRYKFFQFMNIIGKLIIDFEKFLQR